MTTEVSVNLSTNRVEIRQRGRVCSYRPYDAREIADEIILAAEAVECREADEHEPTDEELMEIS